MKKNIIVACISALTLTAVSCSEVKQTDIQQGSSSDISSSISENTADGSAPDNDGKEDISENTDDSSAPVNENKEDIIITMAVGYNKEKIIEDEISAFNEADNGYQIVTKNYSSDFYDETIDSVVLTEEDALTIDFNLVQDIMNTDDIDIIDTSVFGNESKYEILKNMGAFADLYPFMENDPEVNTTTLNQHILSLNETDGKLCSLPMSYIANTMVGETRYVGNKENWTVDEFISAWENMPEGSTVNGSINSENIYYDVLRSNLESFIDYENAEVNFDCAEFRKILEFCNRFESNNNQKSTYVYDAPKMVSYLDLSGINGAKLFGENGNEILQFTNPPYTMVGYPSADGQGAFFQSGGSYSISAKSSPEKQKGAWEFIRQFYTEDYQTNCAVGEKTVSYIDDKEYVYYSSMMSGFCINNKAFDNIAQRTIAGEFDNDTYVIEGVEYPNHFVTQEEVDRLVTYLDSIERWETNLDYELWNIVEDEVMAYFAGEHSIDDTIDMIQNRASIWISEHC
ncbi:MAG: extracellular solute-binding protein [Ruminococcus flavefaciens]|nr:extracellular solute-binding protein [Ruminococcus flavefaciens]